MRRRPVSDLADTLLIDYGFLDSEQRMARRQVFQRQPLSGCLSALRTLVWATLFPLAGCYDYPPVMSPAASEASPAQPKSTSAPTRTIREEEALESAHLIKETQTCVDQFPNQSGRKADQVRCIVSKTDAILDRTHPETRELRRSVGAYAVQLAEREDRGEISHEQAEDLFMQFVDQTPESAPPPGSSLP